MTAASRKQAIENGESRYFTGKPCMRGHLSERYVTGNCIECTLEQKKSAYAESPDSFKNRSVMNYRANTSAALHRAKEWRKSHPENRAAYRRNRRARMASGKHTAKDIAALLAGQCNKCAACKNDLVKYHVDHIMPLSRGGSNGPENLQILCPPCNQSKHAKDPIEWAKSRGVMQ